MSPFTGKQPAASNLEHSPRTCLGPGQPPSPSSRVIAFEGLRVTQTLARGGDWHRTAADGGSLYPCESSLPPCGLPVGGAARLLRVAPAIGPMIGPSRRHGRRACLIEMPIAGENSHVV